MNSGQEARWKLSIKYVPYPGVLTRSSRVWQTQQRLISTHSFIFYTRWPPLALRCLSPLAPARSPARRPSLRALQAAQQKFGNGCEKALRPDSDKWLQFRAVGNCMGKNVAKLLLWELAVTAKPRALRGGGGKQIPKNVCIHILLLISKCYRKKTLLPTENFWDSFGRLAEWKPDIIKKSL